MVAVDPFVGRKVLGRYRVVRSLGRGGMGLIYLARIEGAANFVKPAVVKRAAPDLLAKEPSLLYVLGREARIMSHLSHPSIVRVIDFAEENGAYLLVLDYVHGFHLGQWHRFMRGSGRSFPVDLGIHIVCTVLDALHYAHTICGADGAPLGIVHRDVSPGNVLLDVDGGIKLADFGIARMHSDQTETTSQPSLMKGKFAYMAPELLAGTAPSPSTDVYAAAVVLHELLTGRNELRVPDSVEATIARIVQHVPSRVSEARADVPDGLDDVLARALAKGPAVRYPDAASLAGALRALQPTSEGELDRRFSAAVGIDFRDPQMTAFLGLPDLATLDRAWRAPPPEATEVDIVVDVPVRRSENPTVADPLARPRAPAPVPRIAVGAVVVGLLAAGGAYAFSRRDGSRQAPAPSPVIVVNGQISGADGLVVDAASMSPPLADATSAVATALAAVDPQPSTRGAPAPSSPVLSGARSDGIDALTRAFARHQPQVARCFAANAAEVTGTPEIAIRFALDVAGHVTSAQVLPPALAATPLGTCLTGVARATEFGPQSRQVSFRIPIVARRAP
jgi:eukaryotic-like serine/threonine-protein kinase